MTKAEQYLTVMVCVLMADGVVAEDERALFEEMVGNVGLQPEVVTRFLHLLDAPQHVSIEGLLDAAIRDLDPPTLKWIIEDAYLMANADGDISPPEVTMINRVLERAQVPAAKFGEIRDWALDCITLDRRGEELFTPED